MALTAAFPGLQFNSNLFWRTLCDLDGEHFLIAIIDIIKNTKEFYPGTNVIAVIREKTEQIKDTNTLQIEAETEKERVERWGREASPMPEDCRLALEKLGISLGRAKNDRG